MLTEERGDIYSGPPLLFDMADKNKTSLDLFRVGLCADCLHAQQIESARGAMFYLCGRSATDQRFQKYPSLPVIQCSGHQAKLFD